MPNVPSFLGSEGRGSAEPLRKHELVRTKDIQDILFNVDVRLAGFNARGDAFVGFDDDIERFQRLESPFVAWRDELEAAAAEEGVERDEHGMSAREHAALERFHREGGHANRLPPEKIEHIMRNGVVAFLELKVRDDLRLTLGSVSALSHAPWSTMEQRAKGEHPLWPQYDWRSVTPVNAPDAQVEADAKENLLIVRSSVLPKIAEEYVAQDLRGPLPAHLKDRDLRRLGLAGRGKFEIFSMAEGEGQKDVTFNIGTLGIPGEKSLNRKNVPSEAHNAWMQEKGWRPYADTIVPEDPHHKAIYMYWKLYRGKIARGLAEFTAPKGLLTGKGYPASTLLASAHANAQRMRALIAYGAHEPW